MAEEPRGKGTVVRVGAVTVGRASPEPLCITSDLRIFLIRGKVVFLTVREKDRF